MSRATNPTNVPFLERLSCSVLEAEKATNISRARLYEWIKDGRLESRKSGGRRVVLLRSLKQLYRVPLIRTGAPIGAIRGT